MERTKTQLCLCVLLLFAPAVHAQDDADARKEKRLYQIYRNYYSAPTSNEKWSEALSRSKDQTYTIQKGDTLWGISETFFGDPNFWPKIWSLNTNIYNPHEIAPSGVVSFQSGSTTEPPSLAVGEAPAGGAEATVDPSLAPQEPAKPQIGQYIDLDLSQIKIPPPAGNKGQPRSLPNSVPPYVFYRDPKKEASLEVAQVTRADTNVPMLVTHFASDSELSGAGEVLGTEFGFRSAGDFQEILVKSQGLTTGSRVLAVRRLGAVKDQPTILAYAVNGQLEVREAVNSAEGIYRARVVKAVSRIEMGDILIAEELPSTIPGAGGSMSPVAGKIIGGEYNTERRIFGMFNVVYLNAGSAQGLSVGSHIPVYRNPSLRNAQTLIRENPAEIGELQVVRVADGVATAVVVRQLEDIRVGDTTSPGIQQE